MSHMNKPYTNIKVISDRSGAYARGEINHSENYIFAGPMKLTELQIYVKQLEKTPFVIVEVDYLAPMTSNPLLTRLYRGCLLLCDQRLINSLDQKSYQTEAIIEDFDNDYFLANVIHSVKLEEELERDYENVHN